MIFTSVRRILNAGSNAIGRRGMKGFSWDFAWDKVAPIELKAYTRDIKGTAASKYLRNRKMRVPGELYHNKDMRQKQLVSFDRSEIDRLVELNHFQNSIVNVTVHDESGETEPYLVKAVATQVHIIPSKQKPGNVSFMLWDESMKLRVKMPLMLGGFETNPDVIEGANPILYLHKLKCIWTGGPHIPQFIYIDVSKMLLGMKLSLEQLEKQIPEGLVVPKNLDRKMTIVRMKGKNEHIAIQKRHNAIRKAAKLGLTQ